MVPTSTARAILLGAATLLGICAPFFPATSEAGDAGPIMVCGATLLVVVSVLYPLLDPPPSLPTAAALFFFFLVWATMSAHWGVAPFHSNLRLAIWVAAGAVVLGFQAVRTSEPNKTLPRRWLRTSMQTLTFSATCLALLGLVEAYGQAKGLGWPKQFPAVSATFANPDCMAALLVMALCLCMGWMADARRWGRALGALECFIMGGALFFSYCRSAWLGAAVGLFTVGLTLLRRGFSLRTVTRGLGAFLFTMCAMTIFIALTGQQSPLQRIGSLLSSRGRDDESVRLIVLKGVQSTVARSPLWGCGLDNFHIAFQKDRPHGVFSGYINEAHSDPFQVLVETGIPGVFLLGAAWVMALRGVLRGSKRRGGAPAGVAGALVGVATYSTVNFAIPVAADLIWIATCVGLAMAFDQSSLPSRRPSREGEDPPPAQVRSPRFPWSLACVGLVISVWSLQTGWRSIWATHWSQISRDAYEQHRGQDALEAINRAIIHQPGDEQLYLSRARILLNNKEHSPSAAVEKSAFGDLETALRLNAGAKSLRLEAALLFAAHGEPEFGKRLLREAVQAYPEDWRSWAALGHLCRATSALEEAAYSLFQGLSNATATIMPELARVLVDLEMSQHNGVSTLRSWNVDRPGQKKLLHDAALAAARTAAESSAPPSPKAGEDSKVVNPPHLAAEAFYRLLLEWNQFDEEAVIGLARLKQRHGDVGVAIAVLRNAYLKGHAGNWQPGGQLVPTRQLLFALVDVELSAGRKADATQLLRDNLVENPWDSTAREQLASIYRGSQERDRAIVVLREGVEYDPNNVSLLVALGDLYAEDGLKPLALHTYRQALELHPDDRALRRRINELDRDPAVRAIVPIYTP